MSGLDYLVAAYLVFIAGLFIYFIFIAVRTRQIETELLAIRELMREQDEKPQIEDTLSNQ